MVLQALTPRSWTGHDMYLKRMKNVPHNTPKIMVLQNAPTNPSTVFFGESLIRGVLPSVIPQI